MNELTEQILGAVGRKGYRPLKPKALARKMGIHESQYGDFRRTLRDMSRQGRIVIGKDHTVRPATGLGTVSGTFHKTSTGTGYVRPQPIEGRPQPEVRIKQEDSLDAATGDTVLVRLARKPKGPDRKPTGHIVEVLARATRQFVGTYHERDGEGLVRVDGTVFAHSISVGDPGAKGARAGDKVVFEMVRFPAQGDRGEGVIIEVLGPHGLPGVDTLSIIRTFGLPDEFPEAVKQEARDVAARFKEDDFAGRQDFTADLVITVDPVDARDHDDAVSLTRDEKTGHWFLGVHIADVGYFAPAGSELDREARKRATSVYLPQRVLPMFPEILSNGLASLQEGKNRYVKSVHIEYSAEGAKIGAHFANGVIRVRKRFTYEQVMELLDHPESHAGRLDPEILKLLLRMRDLALILRERRRKAGSLELNMPEVDLEYDDQGRVSGGHFARHDLSHELIEEFMLAANQATAQHLSTLDVPFLRRVHPAPEPIKLLAFAEFAKSLGYKVDLHRDRFGLQSVLEKSAGKPDAHAVHYALLRSLKQAVYSPEVEGHYALAINDYCHFTSPIRRYPDVSVHRLLQQWLERRKVGSDLTEMTALGEHCSKMERRAEMAERELIKLKLLTYLNERIGMELEVIITGVADYGFFAQAEKLPVEGLVHVSTLTDDYYFYEEETHSLIGRRSEHRYRLGDRVRATVVRVDLQRRQMDFRVVPRKKKEKAPEPRRGKRE
jgi:ribonuclease R